MTVADIPFCVAQTAREGWTSTADDFEVHLAHDPDGCFMATCGDRPAAMVTTTFYGATAWIGNLIVVPERRGARLGSLLMAKAISLLESRGVGTLRLEADPLGINIYRRLGFLDEYESPRFLLDFARAREPHSVAPLVAADLPAVTSFDAARFGDDRTRLLPLLLARARAAFRVPRRGAPAGYLMLFPGAHGPRIGPWVAEEPQAAHDLLRAALASASGTAVTLAVPGPNRVAQEMAHAAGFSETPSSLRMVRGPAAGGGRPETVYALANGAVG
jgi:GNAT superfamily N-acetyltransferase